MKKILIIKTGSTIPFLLSKRGDFEHWILSGMGLKSSETFIVDVRKGFSLPGHEKISGVVITGSHSMVTEPSNWKEITSEWIRGAIKNQIPTLGICYGHQLLAYALGGKVDDNPNGCELGTTDVYLNNMAKEDKLLNGFPTPIKVHVSHAQSVIELPEKARLLASNNWDKNQAFRIGDSAWGVQFHPEFDAEIVKSYINYSKDILLKENQNSEDLIKKSVDSPYGEKILKRFLNVTGWKK